MSLDQAITDLQEKFTGRFQLLVDVCQEYNRATEKYSRFASSHEGWAVIEEEVEELWEEIRKKNAERDKAKMREEAVQIAAMALRFVTDCC